MAARMGEGGYKPADKFRPMDPAPRFEQKRQQWELTKKTLEMKEQESLVEATRSRREQMRQADKEKMDARLEWEDYGRQLHRKNMKVRHEREMADLKWKQKVVDDQFHLEATVNHKAKKVVTDELDRFEERLSRMGLDAKSKRAQDTATEDGKEAGEVLWRGPMHPTCHALVTHLLHFVWVEPSLLEEVHPKRSRGYNLIHASHVVIHDV